MTPRLAILDAADRGLPIKVAAEILGCDGSYVNRLIEGGELRAYRLGRHYRVYETSIQDYRARHAVQPKAAPPRPRPKASGRAEALANEALANMRAMGVKL